MYNRRKFISYCLLGMILGLLLGCKKDFKAKPELVNLGDVRDLLKSRQYVSGVAMVVYRDPNGWSVMSGRCSLDGCELTNLANEMVCSCCRSHFNHSGQVLFGSAKKSLPWYKMIYDRGRLYANTGEEVSSDYRFVYPPIEEKVLKLIDQLKKYHEETGDKIPEVLSGKGAGTAEGTMFIERQIEDLNTQ